MLAITPYLFSRDTRVRKYIFSGFAPMIVFIGSYHPTIREAFAGVVPVGHEDVATDSMLYTLTFCLGTNQFTISTRSRSTWHRQCWYFSLRHLYLKSLRDLGFPGASSLACTLFIPRPLPTSLQHGRHRTSTVSSLVASLSQKYHGHCWLNYFIYN